MTTPFALTQKLLGVFINDVIQILTFFTPLTPLSSTYDPYLMFLCLNMSNPLPSPSLSDFIYVGSLWYLTKFRRSGVPTRDSFSRGILKVCVLGRVEARYSGQTRSTNCKSRICKFRIEYYSSPVITPALTWYSTPNNTWIPSYSWITKRSRVICQNLYLTNCLLRIIRCLLKAIIRKHGCFALFTFWT